VAHLQYHLSFRSCKAQCNATPKGVVASFHLFGRIRIVPFSLTTEPEELNNLISDIKDMQSGKTRNIDEIRNDLKKR
jgi:hypothetical protein